MLRQLTNEGNAIIIMIISYLIIGRFIFGKFCETLILEKNNSYKLILKKILVFISIIIIITGFMFFFFNYPLYKKHFQYEGCNEYFQAVFYFLASFMSMLICLILFKKKSYLFGNLYIALSIMLLFVFGEEISWGQRIFNLSIGSYFKEKNIQNEINIHNLEDFFILFNCIGFFIIGFYGTFLRIILPSKWKLNNQSIVNLFTVDYYLIPYFAPIMLISLYASIIVYFHKDPTSVTNSDLVYFLFDKFPLLHLYEIAELLLSMGFLLFVSINWYRQKRKNI